jgi:uncharacterized protein (DUF4415 family)
MPKAFKTVTVEHSLGKPLTTKQKRELVSLAALPDDQIDTTDIPELPPDAWKDAKRGVFYRPIEQAVSLRLDSYIVAWLKEQGSGHQTRANRILRERMLAEIGKRAESWRNCPTQANKKA